MDKLNDLINKLEPKFTKLNEPLSKHTTLKIGGPADIWYEPNTIELFVDAIKHARELYIPYTVLGWGSNVVVSDRGLRGLVIRNASKRIQIGTELAVEETAKLATDVEVRWDSAQQSFKYEFKDLDYDESSLPRVEVKMDSGVDLPFAMNYTIQQGLTGLQWYARIPGTIGGAVYNNTHGGTHFFKEIIHSVRVLNIDNEILDIPASELEYQYDESRFHRTHEIILEVTLSLYKGDKDKARSVAIEWAKRKAIQPSISPGCTFRNLTKEQQVQFGYPTPSVGYLIEYILGLPGFRVGDAVVSGKHHAFIENAGHATGADFLAVAHEVNNRTKQKLGIKLIPEIFFLGFTEEELGDLTSRSS